MFVYQNQITAISQQQHYKQIYHDHQEVLPLITILETHFHTHVQPNLVYLTDYVYDVALTPDLTPYFIEPNSFGKEYTSGSALFHWIRDETKLYNTSGDVTIRYTI